MISRKRFTPEQIIEKLCKPKWRYLLSINPYKIY